MEYLSASPLPRNASGLPMTDSFCCHLDDRRGLFVRRDFSSSRLRRDRNHSVDAAFCHFHIVPNKNWVSTQDDCQAERSRSLINHISTTLNVTTDYLIFIIKPHNALKQIMLKT